jgi:TonB family protein
MIKLIRRLSSIQLSILIHTLVALVIILMSLDFFKMTKKKTIDFEVYTDPILAQMKNPVMNKPIEQTPPSEPEVNARKVFGVNRKSITTTDSAATAVKAGNTTAKENDNLELNKDDADSLPIPVADYLITDEPSVIFEPKNKQRTEEARKNGYTGTARMKILVDTEGNVRDVKLLNELKYGLGERAIEIVKQVKLSPAKVNGKPVAVIRDFTITFKATD